MEQLDQDPSKPLHDRRVVVVGGTSGMGLAAANAAHRAGAHVIAAGRRPVNQRASQTASAPRFVQETVDVTDEASVKALFERVGTLDHLLITSSPPSKAPGAFLEQDVASAQQFLLGKFFGSWAAARWAAPRMSAGGSITFVTGGAAVRPQPGITMISATFTALETLARGLAVELGPLRVNTIRPGYTDSDMWNYLDDAARAALRRKVAAAMPVRRMGSVEDIAHAAIFLMTNPQVTGTVLEVTGGETLVNFV
jgi:NAD(P)-dependent dehydrogenase (short-subunit alcohol dehydrogenase family)